MDANNKKVTIMGLGVFGGGIGAAKYFVNKGASVTVTDLKSQKDLQESVDQLKDLPIKFHLGKHEDEYFIDADIVVVSPAVPSNSPYVVMAAENGAVITSEMNIFFDDCPAPICAVTGSNGKTTTTALLGEMFKEEKRETFIGGNIGKSLIMDIPDMNENCSVVLELSSFQLEDLDTLEKSPQISVVTNLTPNHLDRHGDFENYSEAKKVIIKYQKENDYTILNYDDENIRGWNKFTKGNVLYFSRKEKVDAGAYCIDDTNDPESTIYLKYPDKEAIVLCQRKDIFIPGIHNLENSLAACAAAMAAGISQEAMKKALSTFEGIPHRLETVDVIDGVKYVNDSIATTPDSVFAALKSYKEPIIIIAGGYDKKIPLDEMSEAIANRVKAAFFIGQTGPGLAQKTITYLLDNNKDVPVFASETLNEAFKGIEDIAVSGDVVVMSPGCASYDQYANFTARGDEFRKLVAQIKENKKASTTK